MRVLRISKRPKLTNHVIATLPSEVAIAIFFYIKTMKYRLDECLVNPKTKGAKRFIWIEAYYLSPDDDGELDEVYTENYQQVDLIEALKDIQNHQIKFDPNHRYDAYHCLELCTKNLKL